MKIKFFIPLLFGVLAICDVRGDDLHVAIDAARVACSGISDELSHMKTMAGINTAVTAVGTAAGAGATAVGIVKSVRDKQSDEYTEIIAALDAAGAQRIESEDEFLDIMSQILAQAGDPDSMAMAAAIKQKQSIDNQSRRLGNWRTGLMAANTATNVAGASIAGVNRIGVDLKTMISNCISAIDNLNTVRMMAYVSGVADPSDLARADSIITACSAWEMVDLSSIDTRAKNAAISSGIGAGVGLAGTIVSAVANTKKTRGDNTDTGASKEKNLNTAANILAGGTTVATGAATVFNGTQIAAIRRATDVDNACQGAFTQ